MICLVFFFCNNKPLDRDPPLGRAQWRLKVTASDGQWEDIGDVIINIKDVNDNAPFFNSSIFNATFKENSPAGTAT